LILSTLYIQHHGFVISLFIRRTRSTSRPFLILFYFILFLL